VTRTPAQTLAEVARTSRRVGAKTFLAEFAR
jgi:hypothetical protein